MTGGVGGGDGGGKRGYASTSTTLTFKCKWFTNFFLKSHSLTSTIIIQLTAPTKRG